MTRILATWIIVGLMLASCGMLPTPEPTATPAPTQTPSITPTPTQTPLPTATPTPQPSAEELFWKENCGLAKFQGVIGLGTVKDIAFSPDGSLIVVSSGVGLSTYNSETLDNTLFLPLTAPLDQIVFVSDGQEILGAESDDRLVKISASGEILGASNEMDIMRIGVSNDGRLVASVDWLGITHIVDTRDFSQIASTEAYIREKETVELFLSDLVYTDVIFSGDAASFVTAAFTGRLTVFNTRTGALIKAIPYVPLTPWDDPFLDPRAFPHYLSISNDGQRMAVEYGLREGGTEIRTASIASGLSTTSLSGEMPEISNNGKLIAFRNGGKIELIRFIDLAVVGEIHPEGIFTGMHRFSPNDEQLFVSTNKGVEVWEIASLKKLGVLPGLFSAYKSVMLDHAGDHFILESPQAVEVMGMDNPLINQLIPLEGTLTALAVSKDDSQLFGAFEKNLVVWDIETGAKEKEIQFDISIRYLAATNKPGELLLADEELQIWLADISLDKPILTKLLTTDRDIYAFSPGTDLLATGANTEGFVRVTSLENEFQKTTQAFGAKEILAMAFSPSGNILAVSNREEAVAIITPKGISACVLKDLPFSATSMTFNKEGKTLFLLDQDNGYIYVIGTEKRPSGN